jgi:hypothetical protein
MDSRNGQMKPLTHARPTARTSVLHRLLDHRVGQNCQRKVSSLRATCGCLLAAPRARHRPSQPPEPDWRRTLLCQFREFHSAWRCSLRTTRDQENVSPAAALTELDRPPPAVVGTHREGLTLVKVFVRRPGRWRDRGRPRLRQIVPGRGPHAGPNTERWHHR